MNCKIYAFCLLFRNHICLKIIDLPSMVSDNAEPFAYQIYSTNAASSSDGIVNYIKIKTIDTISQQSWMRADLFIS